jgi:hypothetical protein
MQTVDLQFDPHTYKSCIGFGLKKLKITRSVETTHASRKKRYAFGPITAPHGTCQ